MYPRLSLIHVLLLLTSLQYTTATPIALANINGTKSVADPEPEPSLLSRIDWRVVGPLVGVASLLSLLAAAVFAGTKLDEAHQRAVESHKREQFDRLVASQAWFREKKLPASVKDEEMQALDEAGWEERMELDKEEERHRERVEELRKDLIVKYYAEFEKIQKNHGKGY
jgi:hypothetical protein